MMIVSSQHYIDWEIVEQKMEELNGKTEVLIPCISIGEVDGIEMAIQVDGHHTLTAARELGIEIKFDVREEANSLSGEDALEAHYNDGDWYNVETSNPAYEEYDLVW